MEAMKGRFSMKVSSSAIEDALITSRRHLHCPTKVSSSDRQPPYWLDKVSKVTWHFQLVEFVKSQRISERVAFSCQWKHKFIAKAQLGGMRAFIKESLTQARFFFRITPLYYVQTCFIALYKEAFPVSIENDLK